MPPENSEQTKEETKPPVKSLRTYRGDVEEAIQKNHFSASSILVAEQSKKKDGLLEFETPEDAKARNKFYIIIGSIMLLLGVMTVGAMYYLKSQQEVVIEQKTKTLIAFSEEKTILIANITRDKFITDILSEKNSFQLPVNSVLYLNTVDSSGNPEKAENVLSLFAPQMPASLVRSFENKYMLGIYSFDTNEPFLILITDDFASSFSGMLKWEKDMISDLGKLFLIPQKISTSTTRLLFKDETSKNKDLRVLKGDNGKPVLLYSFIDKNTLVITTNQNILNAIIGKYNISKQVR